MKGREVMFFTTIEDIEKILRDFESAVELHYMKAGLFDDKNIPAYHSLLDIPQVGFTSFGDWNTIDRYLMCRRSTTINIREVPQRAGGVCFAVDQLKNPRAMEIKIGGIYTEKENVIVGGRIATISEDADTLELFKVLAAKIKKAFRRIDSFYVGKSAEQKLKEGWRLVFNERFPRERDLTLN